MKKVSLTTGSPFFRPEQFDTEMLGGKEIAVMRITQEEYLSESVMFSLYSRELEALPYVKTDTERKYLCVTGRFYIVLERGEQGFETSFHYFTANITTTDDEISVHIAPIDGDDALTAAIHDRHGENECSGADCFNEKNMAAAAQFQSLAQMKMIEATGFIRLPYNGNRRKISAQLSGDGKLCLDYDRRYRRLDSGEHVIGEAETGALFFRRDERVRNMLEIVKLLHYAHDFNGRFWAVVETVYSYPADAEAIKAAHPDFYERECASDPILKKQELLDKAKELPYIREAYRVGDGVIHVPVETTAAEISIPLGEFHFVTGRRGYGHLTRRDKGRLRLNGLPVLCSLVEVNRRFKLLYYKTGGFVKCGGVHYAELVFERQSNYLDSLDADLLNFKDMGHEERMADRNALACAGYLMFRNMITPVMLDKDDLGSHITEE
jgi:hypothetical protein